MQVRQQAEPNITLLPKHQCFWEQNGDVQLQSKSLAHNFDVQIAYLVKARVLWPGTFVCKSHSRQARNRCNAMTQTFSGCRASLCTLNVELVVIQHRRCVGWFFQLRRKFPFAFRLLFSDLYSLRAFKNFLVGTRWAGHVQPPPFKYFQKLDLT